MIYDHDVPAVSVLYCTSESVYCTVPVSVRLYQSVYVSTRLSGGSTLHIRITIHSSDNVHNKNFPFNSADSDSQSVSHYTQ